MPTTPSSNASGGVNGRNEISLPGFSLEDRFGHAPGSYPQGAAMSNATFKGVMAVGVMYLGCECALAQDWPQWRGPNRDAKAIGFKAPKVWPKELTQKWKVAVGDGVATPALVGEHLYVFSRQDGQEV